jgi:hypothetical protein
VATDFFTAEVWTLGGLVTYYVLFFIHLGGGGKITSRSTFTEVLPSSSILEGPGQRRSACAV